MTGSATKQSTLFPLRQWIASRSLSSGAHSRDPLARNDDIRTYLDKEAAMKIFTPSIVVVLLLLTPSAPAGAQASATDLAVQAAMQAILANPKVIKTLDDIK